MLFSLLSDRLMDAPDHDTVARAFADVLQRALTRGEQVDVPSFGSFYVDHQPSTVEKRPDGDVTLRPPADTVRFKAPA